MSNIVIAQYGRSWFSAYSKRGRFLAMGKTRSEAKELALQKLSSGDVSGVGSRAGRMSGMPKTASAPLTEPNQ